MALLTVSEMRLGGVYVFDDPKHPTWLGFTVRRAPENQAGWRIVALTEPGIGFGYWCRGIGQYADFGDGEFWKPVRLGFAEWIRTKGK